jgi:hypothetical protein
MMDGLTESEREALEKARLNFQGPTGPDDLMERVYEKSGLDPLQVHESRDPNRIMARAAGPLIALGGILLAVVGGWRLWYVWKHSAFSVGGLAMLVIGLLVFLGGAFGTISFHEDD